jgi:hypothetical protein
VLLILPVGLIVLGLLVVPILVARRFGRTKIIAPAAMVLTAIALWFGWSALSESVTWDSAVVLDPHTIQVTYTGSECEDHRSVSIDQSSVRVVITVKTWSFASGCSDVGLRRRFRVTLDNPLGNRAVLDGNCFGAPSHCVHPVKR